MADLKGKQLQERYQTLLTTSETGSNPLTGILQNGDGNDITQLTLAGDLVFSATSALIKSNTSDGSDNAQITISGGGASGDARGASVHISGNEHGNGGLLQLRAGSGSVSEIRSYTSGTERMRIDSSGNITHSGTSPQYIFKTASNTNFQIAIQENVANALEITPSTTAGGTTFSNPALVVNSSGNVLVGKTATGRTTVGHEFHSSGFARHTALEDKSLEIVRTSTDGEMVEFFKDSTQIGTIGVGNSNDLFIGNADTGLCIQDNERISPWNPSTNAIRDNAISFGDSDRRFKDIYASNGTIQTSDINEKQDIEELNDAELRVAQQAKTLLRKYRWKSSVEEKGDGARIHFGIIAQDLEQAFTDEGLDASRYGMFIKSTWTNEDGEEQTRLGVRYNQLLAFIISSI